MVLFVSGTVLTAVAEITGLINALIGFALPAERKGIIGANARGGRHLPRLLPPVYTPGGAGLTRSSGTAGLNEETDLGLDDDFSILIGALGLQCSWYARAFVNVIPVVLLVDSGAGTTILDESIFSKLGFSESDLAVYRRDYRAANGGSFSVGSCEVSLAVDSVLTRRSVIFADLGSEFGLLGMDYLEQFDCVLHCSSGSLNVAGH